MLGAAASTGTPAANSDCTVLASAFDAATIRRATSFLFVSAANQYQTKEIKFGRFCSGRILGELDVEQQREYLYTLRSVTPNSSIYVMPMQAFRNQIYSSIYKNGFLQHCKNTELELSDKLAQSVLTKFEGLKKEGFALKM